jgi:hypothetical protein
VDDKGSIVAEISDVSYHGDVKVFSLEATPPSETVTAITLKLYAPRDNKPANDVTFHLKLNNSLATAYGLTIPTSTQVTLAPLDVIVPKNTGEKEFKIVINKNLLDLTQIYGLGFELSSVSEGVVSELGKKIVVAIIIRNAYEAEYLVTGYFFHPSVPREINEIKHLATAGTNTCQTQLGDNAGWYFDFDVNGSTLSNWFAEGATPPTGQSGISGFMTADNPGNTDFSAALPDYPGISPWVHSTYNNSYNTSNKTFYMHYGYRAAVAGGDQTLYTRQVYEKYVRQ